jgi:hypothetical protein
MPEANRKKITLFVDEVLHRSARVKIADLDSSFQEVLTRLLTEWTEGRKAIQIPARSPAARDRWHAALDEIFDAGDPDLISTTQHHLSLMRRIATGQPAPSAKKVKAH